MRMKPECRYGHLCRRESPDHWRIFSHPAMANGPESTGELQADGTELKHEQSLVYCDKQLPLVHNNIPDETATNSSSDSSTNVLLMLVGLPGSGKSTFCTRLLQSRASKWRRICQDIISKGKRGSKEQCLKLAEKALNQGLSVMIDRCNLTEDQRHEFLELARRFHVKAEALVLDLPVRSCIQRAVQRTGHEGGLQGKGAPAAIQRMARHKELPSKIEGFSLIITCHTDGDVEQAFGLYQQSSEMGDQARYDISHIQLSGNVDEKISSGVEQGERESRSEQGLSTCVGEGTRTLAFPSISTSDFHFDHERAAEIIIEMASDFLLKFKQYRLRLILVDLKEDSSMLVRVRQKAATCGLRPEEFLAIAGDITKLHSSCGLHCNFIANATNWRLKAGGGGVNAAIFKAAGDELQIETKTRAMTLNPGSALAVPLPATSPLYVTEGVTHVIHVLGPNMNPQRPNCLQGDYDEGCKILRDAYTCMFQAFASAVESQGLEGPIGQSSISSTATTDTVKTKPLNAFAILMQSAKRKFVNAGSDQKAKHGRQDRDPNDAIPSGATEVKHNVSDRVVSGSSLPEHGNAESINASGSYGKVGVFQGESHKLGTSHDNEGLKSKKWEPWAEALREIVLHPEEHKDIILQETQKAILIVDKFPKGRKHFLVVSRQDGLDSIEDLRSSHLLLLQDMHTLGQTWVHSLLDQEQSLQFRMGYHSDPSMRQLHMHIISQDFDSTSLKNKKHWNSFTTTFFRDSKGVMEELKSTGRVKPCGDESSLLKLELRCHRCRSVQPNIPRLKQHILSCQVPFPSDLVQKGYLIMAN